MWTRFGLEAELRAVEERLHRVVSSREPLLEEMARYVIGSGGKRIRPLSAVLAYRAVGGSDTRFDEIVDIAAGLELIHTATLVHDDINDGAKMRRGQPACHRRYGPNNALVAGDFLFTKGFQISGRFERIIVDWTADACQQLAEGEVLQARYLNDPSITLDEYLKLVERKTACFIATGIKIGAYLGGADNNTIEALGRYGLSLGVAFQIVDDILDVSGDGTKTGKRVGIDIRDGNPTLPSILTLQRDGDGPPRLQQILTTPGRGAAEVEAALEIIRASGALDEARGLAHRFAERARRETAVVVDPHYRRLLVALVDKVVDRES